MADLRVVCGTDTGVGKTVVTAALAAAALARGQSVRVLKPVQTGSATDDDAREVDHLVGAAVARTGWRLAAPLAPAVAARIEGVELDPAEIARWVRANADADTVLVETAGGVAVELASGFDMADLAAALGAQVILACRAGLGTLNHTLLSVEHLRARGADTLGLVLNDPTGVEDPSHATNPGELRRLTGLPILGSLGPMPRADPVRFGELAELGLRGAIPEPPRMSPAADQ